MKKIQLTRTTRILIITGAAFLVILLAFRLTLPSIVKNNIERKVSEQLGVKTTVGNISLSLLSGSATIRKISIDTSGFDSKPFLTAQKIFVNLAITSLFGQEIQFELVDIQNLSLKIKRTKEGNFNFKPILNHMKSTSPPSSEEPVKAQPGKGIFLNLLKAENVQISFEDCKVSEPPLLTELKDIAILLKTFRYPDSPLGTGSEINIKGQVIATNNGSMTINSTFQLGKNPPTTVTSESQENFEDIYMPHFNPYVRRYGYIFTSGIAAMIYNGKTAIWKQIFQTCSVTRAARYWR